MLTRLTPSSFFSYFLFLFYDFVSFILSPLCLSGGYTACEPATSSGSLLTASIWTASGNTAHLRIRLQWPRPAGGLAISTHNLVREGITGWGWTWGGSVRIQGQVKGLLPGGPAQSVRVRNQAQMVLYSLGVWLMTWACPLEKTHRTRHLDPPKKAEGGQQDRVSLGLGTGAGGSQWGRGWGAETSGRPGDVASWSKMRSRWSCHRAAGGCRQLPDANSTLISRWWWSSRHWSHFLRI